MDIQAGIQLSDILKWVGLAFAAGFIGYFGRYLGMLIIEKVRKKKPKPLPTEELPREIPSRQDNAAEQEKLKLEKKRAKAEAKRAKKAAK